MNRGLMALLVTSVVMLACASAPPERSSLPDVGEALDPPPSALSWSESHRASWCKRSPPIRLADGLLIVGDVIVAFDDQPTHDSESLLSALGEKEVGSNPFTSETDWAQPVEDGFGIPI